MLKFSISQICYFTRGAHHSDCGSPVGDVHQHGNPLKIGLVSSNGLGLGTSQPETPIHWSLGNPMILRGPMAPPELWRLYISDIHLEGGWATPLKNMSSSIGMIRNPRYGKIKNGNQTTNQPLIPNDKWNCTSILDGKRQNSCESWWDLVSFCMPMKGKDSEESKMWD